MNKKPKIGDIHITHRMSVIRSAARNMRSAEFYAIFLASVILVGFFVLSPVISQFIDNHTIGTNGRVPEPGPEGYVTASSGSMVDIQAAVDQVVSELGGVGNVLIPEGIWDFVPVGTSWTSSNGVRIPAGVNVFGAQTERTSGQPEPAYGMSPNDQVVAWRTVLRIPWDMVGEENPQFPAFFYVYGSSDSPPSRISDIKFSTYRDVDTSCRTKVRGVWLSNVPDFRVDHCFFSNLAGGAIWAENRYCKGVIDHNRAVNTFGNAKPYGDIDALDYGFFGKPRNNNENPLTDYLGKYMQWTVFVEDNYISRWRHCALTDEGGHMIVRHNSFNLCLGYYEIDCHQFWGRCLEAYNNEFTNCLGSDPQRAVSQLRAGGGVWFNNHVDGTYQDGMVGIYHDAGPTPEWYLWDNVLDPGCGPLVFTGSEYATYTAPTGYTPYPYPHPLTIEG